MEKLRLIEAEKIADNLFSEIERRGLIVGGKSERELNDDIFNLADELFGIKKYLPRMPRARKDTGYWSYTL